MALFHLQSVEENNGHFKCPNCDTEIRIDWNTEYAEALMGDHQSDCPKCSKTFNFGVRAEYYSNKC